MAVKYKRDPDVKFDWNVRGRSAEMTRKRSLLIFVGVGLMFFAIGVLQFLTGSQGQWGEMQTDAAQVLRKIVQGEESDSPAYSIECRLILRQEERPDLETPTATFTEVVRTDHQSWMAVKEGDTINIRYRINESNTAIRIEGIALGMPVLIQ
jgi:nitrogen fixation-related uncharacterized protein